MKNILIINQYSANKGDRAVLYSLLSLLNFHGNLLISVSTSDPSDWKNQYTGRNIRFVPWGWDYHCKTQKKILKIKFFILRRFQRSTYFLLRMVMSERLPASILKTFVNPDFYEAAVNADLVISTGGHHVTTILAKNAISSQLFDVACCIILKKRIVLWSQTIGPLNFTNRVNEIFVRSILKKIESIYIRDETSLEYLIKMGVNESRIFSTYETVLSISEPDPTIPQLSGESDNVVGVSIYSTKERSEEELDTYISSLSAFADHCVEKYSCRLLFIPMELKSSGPDDRWLIQRIISSIKHQDKCSFADEDLDTGDHFKLVQNCRYFIGHKTHSVIFALAAATPVIALAYHPKTIEFMKQYGLERYAIPDESLSLELLISLFAKLTEEAENLKSQILKRNIEITKKIKYDFNIMLHSSLNG